MRSLKLRVWLVSRGRKSAHIMGTYVRLSSNAPRMAKLTVMAMGRNILPSMPTSVRMGM